MSARAEGADSGSSEDASANGGYPTPTGGEANPGTVINGTGEDSTGSGTPVDGAAGSGGALGTGGLGGVAGCVLGTEGCACLAAQMCSLGLSCDAGICRAERCGDGRVGGTEECDDGDTDDANSCSLACRKRYNVAFVTSTLFTVANLGGIAGGDAACASRAAAGNLPGKFVAYLTASTSAFESRIGAARGWVRVDGRPFLNRITDAVTYFPPELDELGRPVPAPVLTNGLVTADTLPFAVGSAANGTCNDWTPGSEIDFYYAAGDPSGGHGAWNGLSLGANCTTFFRLYCFQADYANDLTVARAAGRVAFASRLAWAPQGGLAAADAQCAADAATASLPGSFRALLATTTASAASRFSSAGPPWVRVDGIPIVANAADLFQEGGRMIAPLQVTSGKAYLFNHGGWTGSASPLGLGTPETTCNDWRTTGGTAIAGRVQYSQLSEVFGFDPNHDCTSGFTYLYCLEE